MTLQRGAYTGVVEALAPCAQRVLESALLGRSIPVRGKGRAHDPMT